MLIDFKILEQKYNIIPFGVFHVGMHRGEEYTTYKDNKVKSIIFVEANKDLAHEWASNNHDDDCHVVHAAVSDKVEDVEFHITNNGQSSSILELGDHASIYPHIVYVETVKMKTVTIDMINRKLADFKWNVLNLDIQGAELKALKGIENWDNIQAIFIEVNYREMYKGCALEPEITEFLKSKEFIKVEEFDTGSGWGDALYIKR